MECHDKDELIAKLRESEDRYRSVTETSIDAIITTDSTDLILTWNKGAELIFGYGKEVMGQSVTLIIPERYREAHREGVRNFLRTGEKHIMGKKVELEAIGKEGTEFPVELSLSSWESPSGIYFGGIIRDISERKRIERIREDVQGMMRHDLRSPLIGITGLARVLLKSARMRDREKRAASMIQELGEKTILFIDRSRDLFQMEQGSYRLKPRPVELISLLKGVKSQLEPLAQKKAVKIEIALGDHGVDRESEVPLQGDEGLLEIMFANLIKNAIEASPEKAPVHIHIKAGEGRLQDLRVIDIHNRGAISKGIRKRFFEPYATSGKEGGTGLGTHSALIIARTHQGDIRFTTSEEEGTHVIVQLPSSIKVEPM